MNEDAQEQPSLNSARPSTIKKEDKKIEFEKLGVPLYLIKLSCTYFAVLDKASFDFRKKKQRLPIGKDELARSNGYNSTMRETFKKILQKPLSSNSVIERRKNDIDLDIQKPAVTDNGIPLHPSPSHQAQAGRRPRSRVSEGGVQVYQIRGRVQRQPRQVFGMLRKPAQHRLHPLPTRRHLPALRGRYCPQAERVLLVPTGTLTD